MQFPRARWERVPSVAMDWAWDEKRDLLYRSTAISLSLFRRRRLPILLTLLLLSTALFYEHRYKPFAPPPRNAHPPSRGAFDGAWNYTRDAKNLMLGEAQCELAFPELYVEIERAVEDRRARHVEVRELDEMSTGNGFIRAMVYDQQLYLIDAKNDINTRGLASLSALHRALLTSPEPLPNIEFTMMVDDTAESASPRWTYAREKSMTSLWLMPDFGYWSWPEPKIGAYSEVQLKAELMDARVPWARKVDKLIWRGASMDLLVRQQLVHAAEGQDWADVKIMVWDDDAKGKTHDVLTMDEHCQYKFVAHTEGVSYSARLQNLQNCKSVVVAHKLKWLQHHHHLMKSSGPDQNFVEVASDFSNLDVVMRGLLGKGKSRELDAERIAENSVRTFRERYLTPAAETCYWRRLIRGWASVSFEPEFYRSGKDGKVKSEWRGLPFESYLLERRMEWDYH